MLMAIALPEKVLADTAETTKILVVAPHEDDEILAFGAIMRNAVLNGDTVHVVVVSNGDAEGGAEKGRIRIAESVDALTSIGVPKENISFLGYGDTGWAISGDHESFMGKLYRAANPDEVFASFVGTQTYGNPDIGKDDYHFQKFGVHADYTRNNLLNDLQTLINEYRPDHIYTTSIYDFHWGHKATSLFTNEAIVNIKRADPTYSPKFRTSMIHAQKPDGGQDDSWPPFNSESGPLTPFGCPGALEQTSPLKFADRVTVQPPQDMLTLPLSDNLLAQAICKYPSQMPGQWDKDWLLAFVRSDEFYWEKDYSNIALTATVTASAENISTGQTKEKAVDGIADGYARFTDKEWVALGQVKGAWIQLGWDTPHTINKVILYDRPNAVEHIKSGMLHFSDGSRVDVGELDNNGGATVINFVPRTVTSVKFTVSDATGKNIGLSEFEVFEDPEEPKPNLALNAIATASAESESFPASNACDGNRSTRWSAPDHSPNEWISLDLGDQYDLSKIVLYWDYSCAYKYDIQISNDGINWTQAYTTDSASGGVEYISLAGKSARYVKFLGRELATPWGYSMFEMEVY